MPGNLFRSSTLCLSLALSGCAVTSVFSPYPEQAADYRAAITNGTIDEITPKLASKIKGSDGLLYAQESGRLHQLNQQFEASKSDFEYVYRRYEEIDAKAKMTASGAAAGSASLLTNDNALPYSGYGFERIMALHFQALNYLAMGNIEGASVEIRRAALEQRTLEIAHEREIANAEESARQERVNTSFLRNSPELAGMDLYAGEVKSSFQNAYTFYTSAVIWEAMGDRNAALVDYKKAFEINRNSSQIAADIQRVDGNGPLAAPGKGALVIFYEEGFVPARQSFSLTIPYYTNGNVTYGTVAFPYYPVNRARPSPPLSVHFQNQTLGNTETVARIGAMAVKSLKEEIPAMVIRMIIRARLKHELHQQAAKEGGLAGSLVATIYNVASEQADLRNWLTLPESAQVLRTELPAGKQTIELVIAGTSRSKEVEIAEGRITILRVVNANNRLIIQPYRL